MANTLKLELKQKIYDLHTEGWTNGQIARKLGLGSREIVLYHLKSYKQILENMSKGEKHGQPAN